MARKRVAPMDWSILQAVQQFGTMPQHRLADHLGRQRSTVNGAIRRLEDVGWLKRDGRTVQGRGRPSILFSLNRGAGCFAGVELAAGQLHCAVAAIDGTLLEHAAAPLADQTPLAQVLEQVDVNLRGLLARRELKVEQLLGLWAGVNGVVNEDGVVVSCVTLGWHHELLQQALERQYGCPVLVAGASTTTDAAAEALLGAGRQAQQLVYYHVGRGISARCVRRGEALAGATRRAGELGHVVVAPDGPKCECGNRGCLEAVASGHAIVARLRRLRRGDLPETVVPLLRAERQASEAAIVRAVFGPANRKVSEPFAALREETVRYLAMGAAIAIAAYDPEVLVLGGYVFEQNPGLRKAVQRALGKMVLDWEDRGVEVVQGQVVRQDRAVGGAAEMCQRFWSNPHGAGTLKSHTR